MTNLSTPIEYFKKEAKNLFREVQAHDAEAMARVRRVLKDSVNVSLMRVQHVVAVEYGFLKWEDLIKATAGELHAKISMKKESLLKGKGEKSIAEKGNGHRLKLRVPPPGETPLVSFLRGPLDLPTPPPFNEFADLMDTMTMEEQRQWLDEDARRMGLFRRN